MRLMDLLNESLQTQTMHSYIRFCQRKTSYSIPQGKVVATGERYQTTAGGAGLVGARVGADDTPGTLLSYLMSKPRGTRPMGRPAGWLSSRRGIWRPVN